MASELRIDHIDYGGERYEFVDQTARERSNTALDRVNKITFDFTTAVHEERDRALEAERALEESKLSREAGKGLSTNDFTNEYKDMVENPPKFIGCTETRSGYDGVVPAPEAGNEDKFLKADGSWSIPHDTTYNNATQSAHGLLSAADKRKLDGLEAEPDSYQSSNIVMYGNNMTETLGSGRTIETTFNEDGSITQMITKSGIEPITLHTVFNADGSIVRTRS